LRLEKRKKEAAHNLVEYVLILGIVTVALIAMQTYFKRGIQGIIKIVADDMGSQREPVGGGVSGGEVKRQVEAAVKSHYGYDHKSKYTIMGDRTIYIYTLGQGQIKTLPEGSTTTNETSYGILDEGRYHEAVDKLNLDVSSKPGVANEDSVNTQK